MTINSLIRAQLEKLPFGPTVLVPVICKIIDGYYAITLQRPPRTRREYAEREAKKIHGEIKKGMSHVSIFYDNSVSPPTIGDFLNVVMLGRYFALKKISVSFEIVDGQYRYDWDCLHNSAQKDFVNFQIDLVKKLVPCESLNVFMTSWSEAFKKINSQVSGQKRSILLVDRVTARIPFYQEAFNILNYLLCTENEIFLRKVLLSTIDFKNEILPNELTEGAYITWHVRYNTQWGQDRNLTYEQFQVFIGYIKEKYQNKKIVIVSDVGGCEFYKKLINNSDPDIIFSKDYKTNFYEDCNIILNSDFYYQLLGGGIGMVPIYSLRPYEIIDRCEHELPWDYPKFTSWSTVKQKRYFSLAEVINSGS